jgi:DNA-binding IscR family transcriptional regulator
MVHVLTLLVGAQHPVSSRRIAGNVNTNLVRIRQIIGYLCNTGLVKTVPGSAGGAELNRNPVEISLVDVYQLVKSDMGFKLHAKPPNLDCPVGRNIQAVLVEVFDEMDALLTDGLSRITIADMLVRIANQEKDSSV